MPYSKQLEPINSLEDEDLRDMQVSSGSSIYTVPFPLYKYCSQGVVAVYLETTGTTDISLSYETDPGLETGDKTNYTHDWYTPAYRNPIDTAVPAGTKVVVPVSVVVGRYIRFKLTPASGDITIKRLRVNFQ